MKPTVPVEALSEFVNTAARKARDNPGNSERKVLTHSGDKVPEHYKRAAGRPSTIALAVPAQLRKQPRQARSSALVDAIKESAMFILETQGRAALTLQQLSEHSGVAASSIYEYFPGMDALVAALFEDYNDLAAAQLLQQVQALPANATLFDAIESLLRGTLAIIHKLHVVDPSVLNNHVRYLELLRLLPKDGNYDPPVAGSAQWLFERYASDIHTPDKDKALYLFCRVIHTIVRAISLDRPQYLHQPDTLHMLTHMLHSMLQTGATPHPGV
jgi:AcrR family transcriptional regulator